MADHTHIEWTDATWNPVTGCAIVSKGCTNCYAMKLAGTRLRHHPSRAGLTKETKAGPVWTGEVRLNEQWLDQPLRWRRPRRIFVCAHGDLFAEGVPDEWIDRVFAVMALSPQHTFQVLTKRPDRMQAYLGGIDAEFHASPDDLNERFGEHCVQLAGDPCAAGWFEDHVNWPLPNVWLGTSAEDQASADARVPELLATPAAVRFVSAEPLLGPIDFEPWLSWPDDAPEVAGRAWGCQGCDGDLGCDCPIGRAVHRYDEGPKDADGAPSWITETRLTLDWIIVGGESGPNSRPMHPAWARSIRDQCQAAGVAFFFKQWGAWAPICAIGESDHLYHPAPEEHPDASRRCRHANLVMHADGAIFDRVRSGNYHMATAGAFAQGSGAMLMFDIGKAAAGRLLDGREWSELPQPPHAEVPGLAAGPRSTHDGAAP